MHRGTPGQRTVTSKSLDEKNFSSVWSGLVWSVQYCSVFRRQFLARATWVSGIVPMVCTPDAYPSIPRPVQGALLKETENRLLRFNLKVRVITASSVRLSNQGLWDEQSKTYKYFTPYSLTSAYSSPQFLSNVCVNLTLLCMVMSGQAVGSIYLQPRCHRNPA